MPFNNVQTRLDDAFGAEFAGCISIVTIVDGIVKSAIVSNENPLNPSLPRETANAILDFYGKTGKPISIYFAKGKYKDQWVSTSQPVQSA